MDVVRNENGSYSAHVFARQAIHIVENHAKQSQNKVHKHYIFPFVSKDHIFTVRIGSILNPLVRKFSEDTRKKGKGAETGASQDWRSFYLSHMIGLKGSHMTKVHCSLASEWNRLFILWICGAKYSLFVVPHTGMIYNRLSDLSHASICFSYECDSGIIGYNLTDRSLFLVCSLSFSTCHFNQFMVPYKPQNSTLTNTASSRTRQDELMLVSAACVCASCIQYFSVWCGVSYLWGFCIYPFPLRH